MATALHPQTQMTFKFDGQILPTKFGFPLRIRIPTKLGFKNPKHVIGLAVLNNYTGGYWEDQGYNWFSGLVGAYAGPARSGPGRLSGSAPSIRAAACIARM